MNELERQLDQAGRAHRNTRYPGDLADDIATRADVLGPSHFSHSASIGRIGSLRQWRVAAAFLITTGVVAVTIRSLANRDQPTARVDQPYQTVVQHDGALTVSEAEQSTSATNRAELPIRVSRGPEHKPRGLTPGFGLIQQPNDRSLVHVANGRVDEARSTVAGRSFYDRMDLRRPQRPRQTRDLLIPATPPRQITPPTPGASAFPLPLENNT